MFYIFMVWNKSLSIHTLIYDMANNILYENNDVEVKLVHNEEISAFMSDAKGKVKKTNGSNGISSNTTTTSRVDEYRTTSKSNAYQRALSNDYSKYKRNGNNKSNKKGKSSKKSKDTRNKLSSSSSSLEVDIEDDLLNDLEDGFDYFRGYNKYEYPELFEPYDPFDRDTWGI